MAGLSLTRLLPDFPELEVDNVEVSASSRGLREKGIRRLPTLVCGEKKLTGFFLTQGRIRRFLRSL